jgi:hypothetical protein
MRISQMARYSSSGIYVLHTLYTIHRLKTSNAKLYTAGPV